MQGLNATRLGQAGRSVWPLLPGLLIIWLSFRGGGFFAGTTAALAAGLLLFLVLRGTLADRPFEGLTRPLAIAVGALTLLAIWALISSARSDSAARAILQFDLILLYAVGMLAFGVSSWTERRIRVMTWGIAGGICLVCGVGLISRVLPEVWPITLNPPGDRLSYPITYANAMGLLGAIGTLLCLHITSSDRDPTPARVAAAAAVPMLAATVLFTFSRGAIAAGIVGLGCYLALSRSRFLLTGLAAVIPPAIVAIIASYGAELLAAADPTTRGAISQGHTVAWVVGLSMGWSALARVALFSVDAQLQGAKLTRNARTRLRASVAVAGAAALIMLLVVGTPGYIGRQYDAFVSAPTVLQPTDARTRLTDPGNNGRLNYWRIAWRHAKAQPILGNGAGVFRLQWEKDRPTPLPATNAHALYLETLDELGVVGLLLLGIALLTVLGGFAIRIRGPDRALYAALFSAGVLWALAAGIDWHWSLPGVTFWLFALGGAVLARRPDSSGGRIEVTPRYAGELERGARIVVAIGLLIVAITPIRVALSQRSLNQSVKDFYAGDCGGAIDHALAAASAFNQRPEPFEVLGYCDIRHNRPQLAVRVMQSAADRDPHDWEFRYGLAVARAANGQNPRPDIRRALRLNPKHFVLAAAQQLFNTNSRSEWISRAHRAPELPP